MKISAKGWRLIVQLFSIITLAAYHFYVDSHDIPFLFIAFAGTLTLLGLDIWLKSKYEAGFDCLAVGLVIVALINYYIRNRTDVVFDSSLIFILVLYAKEQFTVQNLTKNE